LCGTAQAMKIFFYTSDTALGVEDATSFSGNIQVIPNPSKGSFQIVNPDLPSGNYKIEMTSPNGQKLFYSEQHISESSSVIPVSVSGLSEGLYIIRISGSQFNAVEKVWIRY